MSTTEQETLTLDEAAAIARGATALIAPRHKTAIRAITMLVDAHVAALAARPPQPVGVGADDLLKLADHHALLIEPQVNGGWVVSQTFDRDMSGDAPEAEEIARTRGTLREALTLARAALTPRPAGAPVSTTEQETMTLAEAVAEVQTLYDAPAGQISHREQRALGVVLTALAALPPVAATGAGVTLTDEQCDAIHAAVLSTPTGNKGANDYVQRQRAAIRAALPPQPVGVVTDAMVEAACEAVAPENTGHPWAALIGTRAEPVLRRNLRIALEAALLTPPRAPDAATATAGEIERLRAENATLAGRNIKLSEQLREAQRDATRLATKVENLSRKLRAARKDDRAPDAATAGGPVLCSVKACEAEADEVYGGLPLCDAHTPRNWRTDAATEAGR